MPPMKGLKRRGYAVTVHQVQVKKGEWTGTLQTLGDVAIQQAILDAAPSPGEQSKDIELNAALILIDPHITVLG